MILSILVSWTNKYELKSNVVSHKWSSIKLKNGARWNLHIVWCNLYILWGKLCLTVMNVTLYMHFVTSFNFCPLIQVMHPVVLKRIGILESVLLSKEPLVVSAYKDFDEVRTHRYCFIAKPCAVTARHGRSMLTRCISKPFYFTRCADGRDKTWYIFEFIIQSVVSLSVHLMLNLTSLAVYRNLWKQSYKVV